MTHSIKSRKKKIIISGVIIFFSTIFLIILLKSHTYDAIQAIEPLPFSQEDYEQFPDAVGFLVFSGTENNFSTSEYSTFWGRLSLDSPQDILTAQVVNGTDENFEFILKMFYNYIEVSFAINDSGDYQYGFEFSINAEHQVNIPFRLNPDIEIGNSFSKLTVGIFLKPNALAMNDEELEHRPGLMLNFEINYGFYDSPVLQVDEMIVIRDEMLSFHGLMINKDFSPYQVSSAGTVIPPPNPIQATVGEVIELGFIANATTHLAENLENYVIVSMLNWEQVLVNSDPYLSITAQSDLNLGQHGRFYITAPDTAGFYEFVAFLVPNPINANSSDNFFPLEVSNRFTIEVTD